MSKRMKKILLIGITGVLAGGCSSKPINLPTNVKTIPSGMGQSTYIDQIDHSFIPAKILNFSDLKICAASVFKNDAVILQDASNSYVGAFTGNYYSNTKTQAISGGDVFKLIDEPSKTLIATGNKKTAPQQGGLIVDSIKYDAKITLHNNKVGLIFQNIEAAQQNTGASTNSGYRQIGTWSGARAPAAIATINGLAQSFKSCLN